MSRLLRFANTPYGRRLFGVPEGKEVVKITDGSVHYYTGKLSKNPKNYGARVICSQGSPGGAVTKKVLHLLKLFPEAIEMAEMGLEYPFSLIMLADTGWKSASTQGLGSFTTTGNAYTSDNSYDSVDVSDGSDAFENYETFAFGIPGGATIDGVEASYEQYGEEDPYVTNQASWYSASDTAWSDTKDTGCSVTESTDVVGGAADLWGRTPIDTDFSDANFSLKAHAYNSHGSSSRYYYLDHIQAKVYYTAAAAEETGNMLMFFQ